MSETQISFTCSHCDTELQVPTSLAGVSGPCPVCGGSTKAPRPDGLRKEPKEPNPKVTSAPRPPEPAQTKSADEAPVHHAPTLPSEVKDSSPKISSSNRPDEATIAATKFPPLKLSLPDDEEDDFVPPPLPEGAFAGGKPPFSTKKEPEAPPQPFDISATQPAQEKEQSANQSGDSPYPPVVVERYESSAQATPVPPIPSAPHAQPDQPYVPPSGKGKAIQKVQQALKVVLTLAVAIVTAVAVLGFLSQADLIPKIQFIEDLGIFSKDEPQGTSDSVPDSPGQS